jgi:two-component system C4-dicarboxylate transport sensor histidine kinase DctB
MVRAPSALESSVMRLAPLNPRLLASIVLIIASTALCALIVTRQAERQTLTNESLLAQEQLGLYANTLRTLIDRYRALPAALALDPELSEGLQLPDTLALRERLSRKLERINDAAGSSTLELLDRNGLAVAASNWRTPHSFVGHDYGFRPYFTQTREHGTGRFYAVGVTSGVPGHFLSSAIYTAEGLFLGALVVKLEFPGLEQEWSHSQDTVLVSDPRGVVFIANRPAWRYRTLRPLNDDDRAALARTRQYDKQQLVALKSQATAHPAVKRVQGPQGTSAQLWVSLTLDEDDWTLHLLRTPASALEEARYIGAAAAGLWLSLVLLALLLRQRWRIGRLRERNREQLEGLVEQRTEALRTAQDGLVQAAKLAALGQMAATLAHEINQPLTTQRMQLATLGLLLDNGRLAEARDALQPLEAMLARMSALTRHLKTFARNRPAGLHEPVDLAAVLDQAVQLLHSRLRQEQVRYEADLTRGAWVQGDPIRLEQVLINLLHNALDAMRGRPNPRLVVTLQAAHGHWQLQIQDNGSGIAEADLQTIFEPFFTTKPVGEGLGLGLAISSAIAAEHHGRLTAGNQPQGAVLCLYLPQESPPCNP